MHSVNVTIVFLSQVYTSLAFLLKTPLVLYNDVRGLSQKFVDNMDNFVQKCEESISRPLLFCPSY